MLDKANSVSISKVVDCCNWAIKSERQIVSGRNISLVFDNWGDSTLDEQLKNDPDMYKLRRHRNN
jgi:hypothetical protein